MEKALNEAAKVNKKDIVLLMDRIDFGWSNVDKRMITKRYQWNYSRLLC